MKVTRIEALLVERPLTDRFWMSIFPIGGMKPVARRLILKVYTDAGVVGYGEGRYSSHASCQLTWWGLPQ
jgi:L-alanine-DL-glutamate epimerase-like enolase superfamily enzyme